MKKTLIGVVMIGMCAVCLVSCDSPAGTEGKQISERDQQRAASKIDEAIQDIFRQKESILHYVQVAEEGSKNWKALETMFDNVDGASEIILFLDSQYDKEKRTVVELQAMVDHFKTYMNDRSRAIEFTRGVQAFNNAEKVYK